MRSSRAEVVTERHVQLFALGKHRTDGKSDKRHLPKCAESDYK
jgi:hypothetical protein